MQRTTGRFRMADPGLPHSVGEQRSTPAPRAERARLRGWALDRPWSVNTLFDKGGANAEPLTREATFYRPRRRLFRRVCRSLCFLRLGLVIAKVVLPTRRTFHSPLGGVLLPGSIMPPWNFPCLVCQEDYSSSARALSPSAAGDSYFTASMEITSRVSPLSVPVIFTFCPAKSLGFSWSLSL